MSKTILLLFLIISAVFSKESFNFEEIKNSGKYVIHRTEEKSSGGSIATLSGRGSPPFALFPLPGIFWSPPSFINGNNNTISTFTSGSAL